MAESCLDLTSASQSAQGPFDPSPRPLGPLLTQEKLTDEAVCVCTFSSVLKREKLLTLKSHCEVKLVKVCVVHFVLFFRQLKGC